MRMLLIRTLLVLLALSIGLPCLGFAGELAPGARVRVTLIEHRDAPLVGTLLALPPAALEMRVGPDSTARTILRPDIERLEISRGTRSRSSRGAVRGAVIVGGLGGLAGFVLGSFIPEGDYRAELTGTGLGGGANLGAGLGALMAVGRYERWKRIPLPESTL